MDDRILVHKRKGCQNAARHLSELRRLERPESDRSTVFVQILAKDLECRADMPPKHEEIKGSNDVRALKARGLVQGLDQRNFDLPLVVHLFGVDDQLHGDIRLRLVIEATKDLAKGAFAEEGSDLVTISDVVTGVGTIVMGVVIVPIIQSASRIRPHLARWLSEEIDLRELFDLLDLVMV
jgi:hypothetical protein